MESDILSSLTDGYPHLAEKIFDLLNPQSLANAELVCRQWRSAIADGKCWKKYLLSNKVTRIPKIHSWAACSGDEEFKMHDSKKKWMKINQFYQKLENSWRSAAYSLQEILTHREVRCFSMNATKLFTAEKAKNQWVAVKMWNRKSMHCEREIFTERAQHDIVSMDCNDDLVVTASISIERDRSDETTTTILIIDLKSGKVIHRIVDQLMLIDIRWSFRCSETIFKVRFGHGLLISHAIISQHPEENPRDLLSRLEIRRMTSATEIETSGTVSLVPISERDLNYQIFIGHDENYVVVHHHDPPRFEIISTSSLTLTKTIDSFDNCRSVHYKNGLIVSASAQMGTHTRTNCMIRLWDVETGLCLREIQEPESTRYYNINHQMGFTTNYLVTVPDLPDGNKRILKIRDLNVAMDSLNQTSSSSILLKTRDLDWVSSMYDHFIVDDYQLIYYRLEDPDSSSLYVFNFVPEVEEVNYSLPYQM